MTLVECVQMMNPLAGRQAGHMPDEQHRIEVVADPLVEQAIRTYNALRIRSNYGPRVVNTIYQARLPVLSDAQINAVMNKAGNHRHIDALGALVGKMLQDAYLAGRNDFVLAPDKPIRGLADGLQGKPKDRIRLKVQGNVGRYFAAETLYLNALVEGDCGQGFGCRAENCTFYIRGDVDRDCTTLAKHCLIILDGPFKGFVGDMGTDCVFKTANRETYDRMTSPRIPGMLWKNTYELLARLPTPEEAFK